MKHAYLPFDPINAAIALHEAAIDAYEIAPEEGEAATKARQELVAGGTALMATACATRSGALALVAHLRAFLTFEEDDLEAGPHVPLYSLVEARVGDLTLFLGDAIPPEVIPTELPPRGQYLPPPRRALNLRRVSRPLAAIAGEAFAAALIVVGGIALTGAASIL